MTKLKGELLASVSKSRANGVLLCLRRMLVVAADPDGLDEIAELLVRIRLFKLDKQAARRFYEFEDLDRLAQVAEATDVNAKLIVLLGAEAGFRIGETLELKWDDVDFKRRIIHIRRTIYDGVVDTPREAEAAGSQ